jgi:hypothetical protein
MLQPQRSWLSGFSIIIRALKGPKNACLRRRRRAWETLSIGSAREGAKGGGVYTPLPMKMCRPDREQMSEHLRNYQDSPNVSPVKGPFSEIRGCRTERTLLQRDMRQVCCFAICAPGYIAIRCQVLQPFYQFSQGHCLLGSHSDPSW